MCVCVPLCVCVCPLVCVCVRIVVEMYIMDLTMKYRRGVSDKAPAIITNGLELKFFASMNTYTSMRAIANTARASIMRASKVW